MRKWIPLIAATLGAFVAILGMVLYQVGPDGESGLLAGKGGIYFWWLTIPGIFVGAIFYALGITGPWSTVLGNALLWGLLAFVINKLAGFCLTSSRRTPPDA